LQVTFPVTITVGFKKHACTDMTYVFKVTPPTPEVSTVVPVIICVVVRRTMTHHSVDP
jgi:hypothetical protein